LPQPLLEEAPIFELSAEDLTAGSNRFRRYKQELPVQQKNLFTQHQVDGKGRLQVFIRCWEGLQLLLSKVADRCRVSAFWKDHGPELEKLFPPPSSSELPSQKGAEFVEQFKNALSPILNESVICLETMLDGSCHVIYILSRTGRHFCCLSLSIKLSQALSTAAIILWSEVA